MKVHRWAVDVLVVVALTILADVAILVLGVEWPPARIALLVPIVLFFPGYVLVGVLYPTSSEPPPRPATSRGGRTADCGVTGLERLGLSLAGSLAVVPLLAFALNFTPAGIRAAPLLLVTSWFVVVFSLLTLVRRFWTPADRRFRIPEPAWFAEGFTRRVDGSSHSPPGRRLVETLTAPRRRFDVLLAASVLVLAGSVALAATAPAPADEAFTEYYLVTQGEDGEYVTDGLPAELADGDTDGQGTTLAVAIENHEGEQTTYTTVVQLQEPDTDDGQAPVDDGQAPADDGLEVDRFDTQVAPGQTAYTDVSSVLDTGDGDRRLVFLLYTDDPPDDPSPENAYRSTRVEVTERDGFS